MTIQEEPTSRLHEDEIDLRRYVEVLIKWWREILFLTILLPILAAIVLLLWQLIATPTYTAKSTVVIARTERSTVVDERLETVINEYSTEYTNALVGLVYSSSVAQNVIDELDGVLSARELLPSTLLDSISGTSRDALPNVNGNSDLIVITADSDTPEKAALIANSWATHYVNEVYEIFGQVPSQLLDSMQAELDNAEAEYEESQIVLNKFVADSPMLMLERQITSTLTIADSLIEIQSEVAVEKLNMKSGEPNIQEDIFAASEGQGALEQVSTRIRTLQAELESEQATYRVLSEKRDIAWEAWKTLKGRIDEMSLAQLSMRGQVRLASPAVPPEEPNEVIGLSAALPLSALMGLLLGLFVALFGEFMGRRPFLAK